MKDEIKRRYLLFVNLWRWKRILQMAALLKKQQTISAAVGSGGRKMYLPQSLIFLRWHQEMVMCFMQPFDLLYTRASYWSASCEALVSWRRPRVFGISREYAQKCNKRFWSMHCPWMSSGMKAQHYQMENSTRPAFHTKWHCNAIDKRLVEGLWQARWKSAFMRGGVHGAQCKALILLILGKKWL